MSAIALAAVGLGASIASALDYFAASPTFCAETGCATVRESAWSHPLGLPLPIVGVAFFGFALGLGFVRTRRMRLIVALLGGATAAALIAVQAFAVGAWCQLCLIADSAALGHALAVLAGAGAVRFSTARGLVTASGILAAVGGLALWAHQERLPATRPPAAAIVPQFVQAAQAPGAATIVEVVDFECPFCRRMQSLLNTAIAQARGPVRVVRKMLPLHIHPHAEAAAVAYCCADAQGKGEAMAAALFAAPPEQLTSEGCEQLAAGVGCDLDRYRRDRPAAEARVAAESAEARAAGVHALPTLFIGDTRVEGAGKTPAELTAMIDRARR